jgi:hypothetical protein
MRICENYKICQNKSCRHITPHTSGPCESMCDQYNSKLGEVRAKCVDVSLMVFEVNEDGSILE